MGRSFKWYGKVARGACRTLDVARVIEGHCRRILGFSSNEPRKLSRGERKRRMRQERLIREEALQRSIPGWWPKLEVIAKPTTKAAISEQKAACGRQAGASRWSSQLLSRLETESWMADDTLVPVKGTRRAAIMVSESCRHGRFGDDSRSHLGREHELVVERRHTLSAASFKRLVVA